MILQKVCFDNHRQIVECQRLSFITPKRIKSFFPLSFFIFLNWEQCKEVDVNLNRFEGPHETVLSICLSYVWQEDKLEN